MHSMDHTLQTIFQFIFLYAYPYESEGKHVWLFSCPPLEPLTGSPRAQVEPRARAYLRAVEVHESEILWKLQEGGQGGRAGGAEGSHREALRFQPGWRRRGCVALGWGCWRSGGSGLLKPASKRPKAASTHRNGVCVCAFTIIAFIVYVVLLIDC